MTSWLQQVRVYTQPQLLIILCLGMISGLPFLLTLSTLSFWLAESGVSKTTIGLFMLVSLPYSLKFLWAPFADHFSLPYSTAHFGQRRSWALISQAGLLLSLISLAHCDPAQTIAFTAISSFFVSFFSASQDIIIDAYRIEILKADNRGAGAALEAIGFRFGMLASGAGALYLAHTFTWRIAYLSMAIGIILGMVVFCFIAEPKHTKVTPLVHKQKSLFPYVNGCIRYLLCRGYNYQRNVNWLISWPLFFVLKWGIPSSMLCAPPSCVILALVRSNSPISPKFLGLP